LPSLLKFVLAGTALLMTLSCGQGSHDSREGVPEKRFVGHGPVKNAGELASSERNSVISDSMAEPPRPTSGSEGSDLSDSEKTGAISPVRERSGKGYGIPQSGQVQAEKISGYRVPAECLGLPSKKIYNAIAVVTLPIGYHQDTQREYPLVIAFSGAGECAKAPRSGAMAWMHYYKLDEAVSALAGTRLGSKDFRGLVKPEELESYNSMLRQQPFQGVIVACPYSPLLSMGRTLEDPDYEAYVMEELLPALMARYRVARGKIGVDGVSMGGARSMYYGFKYPEVFATIGSVQGAFGPYFDTYEGYLKSNAPAIRGRRIQLITSDGDSMQTSVQRMHRLLLGYGIPHSYLQMTGPHDYIFNQGPGSIGLLVFHDRILNDKSPN